MKKERFIFLDEIKGYSILLVVFCHFLLFPKESYLSNVVMSAAWGCVPCFMMVSGSLMHQTKELNWKKHFIRIGKIYLTMTIWKILYLVGTMSFKEVSFSKAKLLEYLFLFGDIEGVNTGVMWYMVAFLVALLFFPVSHYLFHGGKKGRVILFYVMCLLFTGSILVTAGDYVLEILSHWMKGAAHLNLDGINRIVPFINYANMLFYYILGAFLFEYREEVKRYILRWKGQTWIPVLLITAGTFGLMIVKYTSTGSFTWGDVYLTKGYLRLSTMIIAVGVYLFFALKERYGAKALFSNLGKYTMGVYYLHYILLIFASYYIFPYLRGHMSFGLNVIKTIVVTLLCVAVTWTVKKIPLLKQLVE